MKTRYRILGLIVALVLAAGESAAQAFPSKPVRIVVGFAPGGGTDVNIRLIAPKLAEQLGQPVVIENKPGAEARIGAEFVAKSAPDGYTLLAGSNGEMVFNPGLFASLPYNPETAFAPITLFNLDPLILAVHPSVPASSIKELIALAKARPGQLFHASAASAFHVATELFNKGNGVNIVHVPYKGGAPAITAAVSGEASMIVLTVPPLMAHMKAGKLRPLATTGTRRGRFFPDVPTAIESGVELEGVNWAGLFAPAGTPGAIIDRIYAAMSVALKDDAMVERLISMGRETAGIGIPPAEFDIFFRKELAKWPKTVRDLGIRGG